MTLFAKIQSYTQDLNQRGLLRTRTVSNPLDSDSLHFDSNDYLSLLGDKRIQKAYQEGYVYYPSGSGASMLLSGYHPNHKAVERAFAEFLAVDECVLFSSGYAANCAVASLLGAVKAHAVIDKGVHASLYDGLSLSQTQYSRFHHNNLEHLAQKLKIDPNNSVVITEGIFSMTGQMAPLFALNQLCNVAKVPLLVDEAHSFGVMGEKGAGAVAASTLTQDQVPLRIIPLGKAFASQGAIVAGQCDWIQALLQAGRSVIYSTAISPALSYGLLKTLDAVKMADDRRAKLKELISFFRDNILDSPLNWSDSSSAIQQLRLGCPYQTLHYAQELKNEGICCSAIRTPTVAAKDTGLRIVLNYNHTFNDINMLFNKLHLIHEHTSH